ncbi:MAG TPA: hypothetical protein VNL16_03000 [Chloroflexota bacterium]|nr:hypothetical protein [Chloroflexota bacterium]
MLQWLAAIRDVAIIVVAILDVVLLGILIVISYVILKLVLTLRAEVMPVLGAVKKTTTTVEGTTDFISTTVARPLIRLVALVFAVTRFFQALFGRSESRGES